MTNQTPLSYGFEMVSMDSVSVWLASNSQEKYNSELLFSNINIFIFISKVNILIVSAILIISNSIFTAYQNLAVSRGLD